MWDRLLTDCHVATMAETGAPYGAIRNAAIGIQDGRIVRVGRRTELAGFRAREVVALGGAWVTPGLIDCHTHLVFAGTGGNGHAPVAGDGNGRAWEATAATIVATRAASPDELLESARRRLRTLMAGGLTTVEVKSGYGLDTAHELRLLDTARILGEQEAVRVVPSLLALHGLPPEFDGDRDSHVAEVVERIIPAVARLGAASSVDTYCEPAFFRRSDVERVLAAAAGQGLPVRLHTGRQSDSGGAELAAKYGALSADHLDHLDPAGARALARAGTVAVLLPGACYASHDRNRPPVQLLRDHGVAMAIATDCNPATSPMLSPTLALNMACTLFGLTPEEALRGMTVNAARALGLADETGTVAAGLAADLCVWRVAEPDELAYWIGLPGPERRIFAGIDR